MKKYTTIGLMCTDDEIRCDDFCENMLVLSQRKAEIEKEKIKKEEIQRQITLEKEKLLNRELNQKDFEEMLNKEGFKSERKNKSGQNEDSANPKKKKSRKYKKHKNLDKNKILICFKMKQKRNIKDSMKRNYTSDLKKNTLVSD